MAQPYGGCHMIAKILRCVRFALGIAMLVGIWQALITVFDIPKFLLPSPVSVGQVLWTKFPLLMSDAKITGMEIVGGFALAIILGMANGFLLQISPPFRRVMRPVLVVSQSIPIYALAPVLVLWLGFDMAPKIAMAVIIIFFPITSAFYDGLRHTDMGLIDLAKTMGASDTKILFTIRLPSALPALGSGLRVGAAVAPIGAIVGEWVGASAGLGYRMIYANARLQTDEMFAALIVLVAMALILFYTVDMGVKKSIHWQKES